MGQTSHSDDGPNRSTTAQPNTPSAMPNRNKTSRKGTSAAPYLKKERPKIVEARSCITANPAVLVRILEITRPARYSGIFIGDAKTFNKLRDQTSSKKAMVTPCITRMKKSHRSTAPNSAGTKLIPEEATELR